MRALRSLLAPLVTPLVTPLGAPLATPLVAPLTATPPMPVAPMPVALMAAALMAAVLLALGHPAAAQEAPSPPKQVWSFDGLFGAPDLAAAQRGFQVYSEVCANCHPMRQLHYRDLTGIGLNDNEVKAVASTFTVPLGLDDSGQPKEGPATPAERFRSPYPNEKAARAALNGANPPDLSLIVNAREGGANYIYGVLTGYADPPSDFTLQEGMYYSRYFPGHQIAMPKPLEDGRVTYIDGTPTSTDQMARDVVTFLHWAANPEEAERKAMGIRVILFLVLLTGVSYVVKRKVWADVH
jgi:ubiquinol-cytochrome c reductase cytochrome c1 subunit